MKIREAIKDCVPGADLLGLAQEVSSSWALDMVNSGRGPTIKSGGAWFLLTCNAYELKSRVMGFGAFERTGVIAVAVLNTTSLRDGEPYPVLVGEANIMVKGHGATMRGAQMKCLKQLAAEIVGIAGG